MPANYGRYCSPQYDKLYQEYRAERDQARRNQLAIQMNNLLVSEMLVIPLVACTQPTDGKSKELQGITPNPWDSPLWNIAEWTRVR
jgi:peptide/nickel transport system substrate-binding protein